MTASFRTSGHKNNARRWSRTHVETLEWYAEQVAGCRKLGSIGDPFRHALDADGGRRAKDALALLTTLPQTGEVERANAHLIAAAPDLYSIGAKLLAIFDHPTNHVTYLVADELRAALAKARGEA